MKDNIFRIGFILLAIGVSLADSENLLIPCVITGVACAMLFYSSREV